MDGSLTLTLLRYGFLILLWLMVISVVGAIRRDLVVGSRTGADGILRIYNGTASDGDFRSVAPEIYRGFAEIADATYKERIY